MLRRVGAGVRVVQRDPRVRDRRPGRLKRGHDPAVGWNLMRRNGFGVVKARVPELGTV
jgi:hypothetical protein